MSNRWEEAIQKWYTSSHTSNLEYLDLATITKPSNKELAHNLSVIYDRVYLSSRVHLRNLKLILEHTQSLEQEVTRLKIALTTLTSLFSNNKPLTRQKVQSLVAEISKQPKLVEEEALRLTVNLDQKLQRVEQLLSKIEKQIFG